MRFRAGDIVRIASNCAYIRNGGCDDNPKDMNGTIREIEHNDVIVVDWDNGEMNEYGEEDLRLRCRAAQDDHAQQQVREQVTQYVTYRSGDWRDTTSTGGTYITGDAVW